MTAWPTWDHYWTRLCWLEPFVKALRERQIVAGYSAANLLPLPVGGDIAPQIVEDPVPAIHGLQANLELIVPCFINTTGSGYFEGQTEIPFFTLATWRAAAGLPAGGFTRQQARGGAESYGLYQAGDLISKLTFDELKAGMQVLKATKDWRYDENGDPISALWSAGGAANTKVVYSGVHGAWNDAKADAEALWDAQTAYAEDAPPLAVSNGWQSPGTFEFYAGLQRRKAHMRWAVPPLAADIYRLTHFYVKPAPWLGYNSAFWANGDPVGSSFNHWHGWWGSGDPDPYTPYAGEWGWTSNPFGLGPAGGKPYWCNSPSDQYPYQMMGYDLNSSQGDHMCIHWWNVEGGFEYQ